MRYATYGDNSQFDLVVLAAAINTDEIKKAIWIPSVLTRPAPSSSACSKPPARRKPLPVR